MFLKFHHEPPLSETRDPYKHFTLEVQSYLSQKFLIEDRVQLERAMIEAGTYRTPFELPAHMYAADALFEPFELLMIRDDKLETYLFMNCSVFVMSNDGKTIDRFAVRSNLTAPKPVS